MVPSQELSNEEAQYQDFLEGIVKDVKQQFGAVSNTYEIGRMIPDFLATHEAGQYQGAKPESLIGNADFKQKFIKHYETVILHGNV